MEQPLPENGSVQIFTGEECIAPFEIKTAEGEHYFIKLVDAATGETIVTVFVHGGTTVEVDVPLGTYELRYASGEKWYGYDDLFGPDTSYTKAEDLFDFCIEGDYVSGYTVTLYRVTNGNLGTESIEPAEF